MSSKDLHAPSTPPQVAEHVPQQSFKPVTESLSNDENARTRHAMISALNRYLFDHWTALPDSKKRAIDFNTVPGSEDEAIVLNELARLFMSYADIALQQALAIRQQHHNSRPGTRSGPAAPDLPASR